MMNMNRTSIVALLAAWLGLCVAAASAQPKTYPKNDPPKAAPKAEPMKPTTSKFKWVTSMMQAELASRKTQKPILMYFCGSDWDDYTRELDEQVIEYDYFHNWAKDKVILVKVDFQAGGNQSKLTKAQNKELKERFQVTRVPTFVFIDKDGNVIGRAGYDHARLRKDEKKGVGYAWVQHAEAILEGKAPPEDLNQLEGVEAGTAFAKENGLPLLMIIYNPKSPVYAEQVGKLLQVGKFVRFINTSMCMAKVYLPDDEDKSAEAEKTRKWLKDHKVSSQQPLTLALWDSETDDVKARLTTFSIVDPQPTILALERALPKIEYKGEWITNYRKAKAIAAQSRRSIVIAYTGLSWCPHCQKLEQEIFNTATFKDYARYNLVLLRVDFPQETKATTKKTDDAPAAGDTKAPVDKAKKDRDELADMYGIRGFPTVVVLNAASQKIATSGYIKGGPDVFLSQLKAVRDKDLAKHDHPSQW